MKTIGLMAISPLDGRYQEKVTPLRQFFSEFGLIKFRVLIEVRWLQTLASEIKLSELNQVQLSLTKILNNLVDNFTEADANRIKQIEANINHDTKAIEYFIKEKLNANPEMIAISEFVHFGCTSEDINNLAYAKILFSAREQIILPTLQQLIDQLKILAHEYANIPMLSRTHGQAATPTTLGKEIANVVARLQRQIQQFRQVEILGKFNGASGNYNALVIAYPNINWEEVAEKMIKQLGLTFNPYTTQIESHDFIAEYFAVLIRLNTILLDFNRDIWGYIALNYFKLKKVKEEVGSSTMPHKINPIDFENAEGNLGIANALMQHFILKLPVSRWQRDLSDSTVLRNMGVALGHSLLAYFSTLKGIFKLEPNYTEIANDLNNHWEILAEAVQTVMRRYQLEEPYEKLKTLTQGNKIDKETLQSFIQGLNLPESVKKELLSLHPNTYLGYAATLAAKI